MKPARKMQISKSGRKIKPSRKVLPSSSHKAPQQKKFKSSGSVQDTLQNFGTRSREIVSKRLKNDSIVTNTKNLSPIEEPKNKPGNNASQHITSNSQKSFHMKKKV